jgi:hypothetical protein
VPPRLRSAPVAGDVALRPLIGGPVLRARVVAATPAAAYAAAQGQLLGILTPAASRVPCGLLPAVGAPELVGVLRPGDEVVVGSGAVVAGGVRLVPSRWWDSLVPHIAVSSDCAGPPGPALDLPGLPPEVDAGARALEHALACPGAQGLQGAIEHAVSRLVGLGPGLTPAGDDVLAGALVAVCAARAHVLIGRLTAAVRPVRSRTTVVSAAFLDHAASGRAVPELGRFVAACARGRADGRVVQDLVGVGASSGAALARGAQIGLRAVAAATPPTRLEVA